MLRSFELQIQRFFFGKAPIWPMVVLRVVLGLSMFFHYLSVFFDDISIFGPDGVLGHRFFTHVNWASEISTYSTQNFNFLNSVDNQIVFYILHSMVLAAGLSFAIGLCTRISGFLLLMGHLFLHAQIEFSFWGWGDLVKPFLIYVVCSDAGKVLSLDALLKHGSFMNSWRTAKQSAWTLRITQIHLCMIYLVAGWFRYDNPDWQNGSMVYGILTDSVFSRIDTDLLSFKPLIQLGHYLFWFAEIFAPILLWVPKTRIFAVAALIGMHAILEIFTMVGYWNYMLIGALTSFLVMIEKPEK